MAPFFYMDGSSFLMEKGSDTYQVGEVLNSMVDMWDVDTCHDVHGEGAVTQEDLEKAIEYAVDCGCLVQY